MRALKLAIGAASEAKLERAFAVERHCFASTWGQRAHMETLEANLKHHGRRQQLPSSPDSGGGGAGDQVKGNQDIGKQT